MTSIDTLKLLLENEDNGEKIATLINSALVDDDKKLVLTAYLSRIKDELNQLNNDVGELTNVEKIVKNEVISSNKSWTQIELSNSQKDTETTLKHRTNVSAIVTSLVKKGHLGRYKEGRTYFYVNPKDAVKRALIMHKEWDESSVDIVKLAEETGMPIIVVYSIVESLQI